MATSKIKIYQTVLTPSRNALVDDLETYLNSLTPTYSENNFQYIKLGLDINVKVPMPQSAISGHSIGNYVRIEQDNKVWYYFVMNTDWKSTSAVELKLSIDSINTFRNDLTFTDKTLVGRQHGNRLLKQPNGDYLIRTVDPVSEQIPADKNVLWKGTSIYQTNLNYDWYLIYKTRDELSTTNPNNPVYCYCIASQPLVVSKTGGGASRTLTPTDLPTNQYNYVLRDDNLTGSFSANIRVSYNPNSASYGYDTRTLTVDQEYRVAIPTETSTPYGSAGTGYDIKVYLCKNIKFVSTGSNISMVVEGTFVRNESHQGSLNFPSFSIDSGWVFIGTNNTTQTITLNSLTINSLNFTRVTYDGSIPFQYAQQLISDKMTYNIGSQVTRSTIGFTSVDRTDSKIIKIIKLPYAPCRVTYSNGVYTFPNVWTYENGYMRLNDASLSTEFINYDFASVKVPELFVQKPTTISTTAAKNITYESKLYHSDFYDFKFVYDSFVKNIQLEKYETYIFDVSQNWTPNNAMMYVSFKPTNTINSKFAFRIDPYLTDASENWDFANYKEVSDYQGYLLISRNNEETIFSNDYLNYIRTGYNYDKKSKEEQASKSYLLAGVQLAAGIASFAVSAYTGGVSAAAGISLVSGAIATFASNAYTQANNERALQSKLANLAAQSSGVAGSDDVDLLSYYNKNRLQIIKYETEYQQRKALFNYFFYCGYKRDRMQIPNTTSRYWFNFIQCKPVFTEEGVTPYNDFLSDIKSRYEAGVTVYHHHAGVGTEWDWQQQYENWETDLL